MDQVLNPLVLDPLVLGSLQASAAAGIVFKNSSGNTIFTAGAGPGTATAFAAISASGQITSTVSTGTAPLVIASTTAVANLNASLLLGQTWASPGAIGGTTPAAVSCTTLTAASSIKSNGARSEGSYALSGSGPGVELGSDATYGYIVGYNRTTSAYAPVAIYGTVLAVLNTDAPGTPSAGQVLIGGGELKTAGAITAGAGVTCTTLTATGTGGVGYATGAGGAVTQGTSRATGVTLNKICGAITLYSAAGSATAFSFTVTNSTVAATDVVHVCQKSGTDKYVTLVTAVAAGSFEITAYTTGGTTTEQPVFNFAVIKAVAA